MALDVCFVHPDLGIGGAERLVVDAAVALASLGHSVCIATAHHDNKHCFDETRTDKLDSEHPKLQVSVFGDFLPRSIFGRFKAVCAYLRMIYVAFALSLKWHLAKTFPDVIFVDQISACIPILRLTVPKKTRIIFYCHFPDLLLSKKTSWLKQFYRTPIDSLEEVTTGKADIVLVNSNFTANVFKQTFKGLRDVRPRVLYPAINTNNFDKAIETSKSERKEKANEDIYFLSINRFERKKNLDLAIKAFGEIRSRQDSSNLKLVMAGGYDLRVDENVECASELEQLAFDLNLTDSVTFNKSPSDNAKISLLLGARGLIYTPSEEHFGIVPLEAMYCGIPVIAVTNGGPLETVVHCETGFLCENTTDAFADAMEELVNADEEKLSKMATLGRKRVAERFSFNAFRAQLSDVIDQALNMN